MNYIAAHVLLVLDQELLESIGIEAENMGQKIFTGTQHKLRQQHVPQVSQDIRAINGDTLTHEKSDKTGDKCIKQAMINKAQFEFG